MYDGTEIQGKSILVRVSARFEIARVRVIGSQLYYSVNGTGILGKKKSECFYQESNLRPSVLLSDMVQQCSHL